MAVRLPRRAARAAGRAGRPHRACRAGCSGCRTWATGCRTGSRRRTRTTRSRRGSRVSQARAARKPRSAKPAPPDGRRRRRRSARRCRGAAPVETPPMSQRSQVANSGSSPIEQCSAACAAPGMSAAARPASASAVLGHGPPDRGGAQRRVGQVERLLAEHLAAGLAAQEGDHLVGDVDVAERQPASPQAACSRSPTTGCR